MQKLVAVEEDKVKEVEKRMKYWQQSAGHQIKNEVSNVGELVDANENIGIAIGYRNCLNDLGLLDKEIYIEFGIWQKRVEKETEKKCSKLAGNRALI